MQDRIEANKAVVLRYMEEMWNQGKLEIMSEILAPKYHSIGRFISAWRDAFPDRLGGTLNLAAEKI